MATREVHTDLDFQSVARILNLPTPAAAAEPATKSYVDSAVEGLAWKDSVRGSTQGNVDLSAPGATIDGISMSPGDRMLVRAQTTASQNGIYVWNGAATPATRAPDASTAAELEQAVTTVEEGTDAGTSWRQTAVNFTLDTDAVAWTAFGTSVPNASETTAGKIEIATQAETDTGTDDARAITPLKLANWSGRMRKAAALVGDGAATSFAVTHNFNTRDVLVQVYRNSGSYDEIICEVRRNTVNQVTVLFAAAPAANAFEVVVIG